MISMFFRRRSNRVVSSVVVPPVVLSRAELDSHADTSAFGDSAFIIQDTLQSASVSPFLKSFGIGRRRPNHNCGHCIRLPRDIYNVYFALSAITLYSRA
jgi:hypothetical protein